MKKSSGFGMIGVVLVVAAVALVGLIGWRLYDTHKNKQTDTATNQKSATDTSGKSATQSQTSDPYLGWKTYCDDTEKVCFKYPFDWTVSSSNQSNIVSVTLKNPTGSLVGSYSSYDTRDGAEAPYYTASLEDISTANGSYKAVGGFDVSSASVYPRYKIVDAQFAKGLIVGQQTAMTNTARFTLKNNNTGHLEVYPVTSTGFTVDQAKAWFASDDAKTAFLVVKSFYFE